ncbi:serpin family protein [Mycoplasmatota bacterium]|nr:serpin family protein [Mycoplasmatota bacterium]
MNKILTMFFLLVLSSTLIACEKETVPLNEGVKNPLVTEGNSEFAFDIFRELNNEDYNENIFISPFSISSALAMTLNGAAGDTKDSMQTTLQLKDISIDDMNNGFAYINYMLTNLDDDVEINIANSLWVKDEYTLNKQFEFDVKSNFNAYATLLDFEDDKSVDVINEWVSDKTNDLIDEIIKGIDPYAALILINAIYFNGSWQDEFNPSKTQSRDFTTIDNNVIQVDMMNRTDEIGFYEDNEITAVKLPYGDGSISMYCVLPNGNEDINYIISGMNVDKWNDLRNDMNYYYEVTLELPKFKMEYGIKALNDALIKLGMDIAFDNRAYFPDLIEGMEDNLYINVVSHKAVVDVSEEGTEAAAVTSITVPGSSALVERHTFIANRPFMFIIGDEEGNILFIGKKVT